MGKKRVSYSYFREILILVNTDTTDNLQELLLHPFCQFSSNIFTNDQKSKKEELHLYYEDDLHLLRKNIILTK